VWVAGIQLSKASDILLTTVYIFGLIFRPRRLVGSMGLDSVAVLIL
jgi:hypothetical protein